MAEETHKIKHPVCPECGKPMRMIVPINMAVCDECGKKYYIEQQGDEYVVVGDYYKIKAQKIKEEKEEEHIDWVEEPEPPAKEPEKAEEPKEKEVQEKNQENEEKPDKSEIKSSEEKSDVVSTFLPAAVAVDTKYDEFQSYVDKYVTKRYWMQVAKEELKKLVSELYDAGALGNNFNPSRVARILMEAKENMLLPFYGVEWLDRAVTKELVTRIWLKLQGYKEIMRLEKLKYYIAIYHPEDIEKFLNGNLPEITAKKYLYEMEALED